MANFDFELVEKLRDRANVSYEDAKGALEACEGDLLEALIHLEKQGKVAAPAGGNYTSKPEEVKNAAGNSAPPKQPKGESFNDMWKRFCKWAGNVLHKGNTRHFEVYRNGSELITVPVTVLVLLLLFAFWVTVPLLVIGLFMSCRYSFSGGGASINVNEVMDSAANAAETLKNEVISYGQNNDKSE